MFVPTIGLEIHTQLRTKTKLFCSDKNDSDETTPNTNVCPVCMGHPGTLPVLNKEAVRKIIQAGIALSCGINQLSKFDRKSYFYPDLPKGYQISQYDTPFCATGSLVLSNEKKIRIRRIHLEEDTGRLIHKSTASFVDFNRAGAPLMELVTEPDFTSADETAEFAKKLQLLWRYMGISHADMEKGEMRVEANISLSQRLQAKLGTKVEVKNLNSFRAVKDAIEYEIKRQSELLWKGEKVKQETRGWDPARRKTFLQREKETEMDYRYFPEPDLPPVAISDVQLEEWRRQIPELPWERKTRFIKEYGLSLGDAEIFVEQKEAGEYYEEAASELLRWEEDVERKDVIKEHIPRLLKLAANYMITEFPRAANTLQVSGSKIQETITPENFAELIVLIHTGVISSSGAQEVLLEMAKSQEDPHSVIERKGLKQISEESDLGEIVREVIRGNQNVVGEYKKGKINALQFLIGKAMAASKRKANPQALKTLFEKFL